jgi:hypothetical protein
MPLVESQSWRPFFSETKPLGLPKAYKGKNKNSKTKFYFNVWSINITTSAQKIALLFVGPPKHNLLLKVDLEEVSHNFLVTRAFCWQGIVTIQTPCFVCYWGVNKVDFTYNGGLFSLGQCNMKLTTQRGSILTTRVCKPFLSQEVFV